MLACHVTIVHDCRGPSNTITCNEASSALSLCESTRVIERGAADACLTGGAEYKLNPLAFIRQEFAQRLARAGADDDPATIARPYDTEARGTVLGEGGGILIVEEEESARKRGATPYAAVTGFASTQTLDVDAVGTVYPADDESMADAIRFALDHADVGPDDIDAIVPFGSSIPTVDAAEATAIRAVFGARAVSVPLVTTVPNIGNCVAGNSAVSLALAAKCLREQTLPARLASRGVEGLDAAACATREATLGRILVTTASQCGQNVAVVLEKA
jgi:3-oxoacyl-[acyl-carrier-protein] synthase II